MEPYILLLLILILLSAFFSGSEIAMFSLSQVDVRVLSERKVYGAKTLAQLLSNQERLLATILIGNNFTNISAAGIATVVTEQYFHTYGVSIAIGVMTLITLLFGEIAPKGYCSKNAQRIAPILATPLSWFHLLFFPLSILLEHLLKRINRPKAVPDQDSEFAEEIAEQEVKIMAQMGVEEGTIKPDEYQIIENAFKIDEKTVEDIMTPLGDIYSLSCEGTVETHLDDIQNSPYSRIPLYSDEPGNIVGILYQRDILNVFIQDNESAELKTVMKKPQFIPEQMMLTELLKLFQKRNVHISIVVDEYGQTVGLVTLEDILEELVGEIEDETDIVQQLIQQVEPNKYLVDGNTPIDEINNSLGLSLPADDNRTISGLVLEQIQHIPQTGEKLRIFGFDIIVKEASRKKIIKLLIQTNGTDTK